MSSALPVFAPLLPLPIIEPTIVYHYTSLETMMKIVETQQLWATNVKFLNDTAERKAFLSRAMDRLPSFRDSHITLTRNAFDEALEPERQRTETVSYLPSVVSFSRDSDSLPQWRAYCPKGRGVAIGFDVDSLKHAKVNAEKQREGFAWMLWAPQVRYGRVRYLNNFAQVQIDQGIIEAYNSALTSYSALEEEDQNSLDLGEFLLSGLEDIATFFKDGSFESEREYRIVAQGIYSQFFLLNYRCNDWSMIPYLKVDVPNPSGMFLKNAPKGQQSQVGGWQAIREVVIGPTADKMLTAEAVHNFFLTNGMNVEIKTTAIPFRDW